MEISRTVKIIRVVLILIVVAIILYFGRGPVLSVLESFTGSSFIASGGDEGGDSGSKDSETKKGLGGTTIFNPLSVGNWAASFTPQVGERGRDGSSETTAGNLHDIHKVNENVASYYAQGFIEDIENRYDLSPYAGIVTFLDRTSSLEKKTAAQEYFILKFSASITRPINITGWTVSSNRRRVSYTFPKGVRTLGAAVGLQREEPIVVEKGGTVIVSSGRSPTGSSFLENKCSGYRSQFKKFYPTIKTKCPSPSKEFERYAEIPYTDDRCYSFVDKLSSCTTTTKLPTGVTKQCHAFLENVLTERGCVLKHKDDSNFYTNQWRIFLNSEQGLWDNKEDVLFLFDDQRRLVATYFYKVNK